MNLKKLEVFHNVAKHNSFSKAAAMLLVTPAAVSIQIRDLETYYGITLFSRSGNQVKLTEIGEALFSYTAKIFEQAEKAETLLLDVGRARKGTLRIGAEETGAKYVLPTFISAFQKEYPDFKVIVKTGISKYLAESLGKMENDLVLVGATDATKSRNNLPFITVGKREIFLVVSNKHALFSKREEVELNDLKKERIILSGEGTAIRYSVTNTFKKHHFHPEVFLEGDSLDFIKAMVAEAQAMAFLPYPPVRTEVNQGIFKTLRLSCERIYLDLRVFFLERESLSPPARRFIQILKEGLMS